MAFEASNIPSYLVRCGDGTSVFRNGISQFNIPGESQAALWSPDGAQLAVSDADDSITVFVHPDWDSDRVSESTATSLKLLRFPTSAPPAPRTLRHIQWSPKGTFLVGFWQHDPRAVKNGFDERNVLVWATRAASADRLSEAGPVAAFTLKALSVGQWPILKWRNDEQFCCLSVRSELIIFNGQDIGSQPLGRVPIPGIVQTELAPGNGEQDKVAVAAFSPAAALEGNSLFRLIEFQRPETGSCARNWTVTVEHPLGSADSADMSWNAGGTAVLILASTTIDSAGENYGGVGDAHLVRRDGSLAAKINKHVAQEACWSPERDEFVLVEGKSPSDIFLYDANETVRFTFPSAYRNTVRWDLRGHMLAVGGFGNLAGDLSFWHRSGDEVKHIAEWREPCTVLCAWDPTCRFFVTASTWPRMRVDNQFKVFSRRGDLIFKQQFAQLFDFQWRPSPKPTTPLPPPLPQPNLSAACTTKKFRPVQPRPELLEALAEEERKRQSNRKQQQQQQQQRDGTQSGSSSTATTPRSQTVAPKNAAKNERSRQLDAISDWRAGEKFDPLPKASPPEHGPKPTTATTTPDGGGMTVPPKAVPTSTTATTPTARSSTPSDPPSADTRSSVSRPTPPRWAPPPPPPLPDNMPIFPAPPPTSMLPETNKTPFLTASAAAPAQRLPPPPPPPPIPTTADPTAADGGGIVGLLKSILPPEARIHITQQQPLPVIAPSQRQQEQQQRVPSFPAPQARCGPNTRPIAPPPLPGEPTYAAHSAVPPPDNSSVEELRRLLQQQSLVMNRPTTTAPTAADNQAAAALLLNALLPPPPKPAAAAAAAAGRHHRPDPMWDTCWEYVDPSGAIRGPFNACDMRHWFLSGFLKPTLPVRCCSADSFIPLAQLYVPGMQPFAQPPRLPPRHQTAAYHETRNF